MTARPRTALIGPTHPYTGGIATHTTALAHALTRAGCPTEVVSWSRQYPQRLYPGTARVPGGRPEVTPFAPTTYPLAWNRPDTWWRTGRRLRAHDLLVLTVVTPFHAVPYAGLLAACGRGPRRIALVHNVLPHEPGPLDRVLARRLLASVHAVLVHSEEQRRVAVSLGVPPARVHVAPLTLPFDRPAAEPADRGLRADDARRLLFFGTVRRYKGLELLLRALPSAPGWRLVVAGDFWEPIDRYRALVDQLGLGGRVELRPGYVAEEDIGPLFGSADALVLPYVEGTATVNVALAARHGLPVVASDAGTLAEEVRDGVEGVVVPAGDVDALAGALRRLAEPGELARLAAGVQPRDTAAGWAAYVEALLAAAGSPATGQSRAKARRRKV
jgi:glycosyltransferase involved in cell wall biosynthesis